MASELETVLRANQDKVNHIYQRASQAGIDPYFALAQAYVESRFKTDAYNAESGAAGIFQFIPSTWQQWYPQGNPYNFRDATEAYIRFMRWLLNRTGGNMEEAARQYYAGPYSRPPLGADYARRVMLTREGIIKVLKKEPELLPKEPIPEGLIGLTIIIAALIAMRIIRVKP